MQLDEKKMEKVLKKVSDLRNYCKEKEWYANSGFTIFKKPESC